MAYSRRRNPFDSDSEDDGFENISSGDPELNRIRQEIDFHRQRAAESTNRSLQMVFESQSIASDTAGELSKQGDQLRRTEQNIKKIQGDLKQSDRHLTSLKSIWGTIGNYFRKAPPESNGDAVEPEAHGSGNKGLAEQIKNDSQQIKSNMEKIDRHTGIDWEPSSRRQGGRRNEYDIVVDQNLDQISSGLDMLKQQALALGNTIDEHNEMLGRIQEETEKADAKIGDQNLKIRKILK